MSSGLESKLPISISELSGLVNGDLEALIFLTLELFKVNCFLNGLFLSETSVY
jgi:hypothetical protein